MGPLLAQGFLGDLYQDFLPFAQQFLDGRLAGLLGAVVLSRHIALLRLPELAHGLGGAPGLFHSTAILAAHAAGNPVQVARTLFPQRGCQAGRDARRFGPGRLGLHLSFGFRFLLLGGGRLALLGRGFFDWLLDRCSSRQFCRFFRRSFGFHSRSRLLLFGCPGSFLRRRLGGLHNGRFRFYCGLRHGFNRRRLRLLHSRFQRFLGGGEFDGLGHRFGLRRGYLLFRPLRLSHIYGTLGLLLACERVRIFGQRLPWQDEEFVLLAGCRCLPGLGRSFRLGTQAARWRVKFGLRQAPAVGPAAPRAAPATVAPVAVVHPFGPLHARRHPFGGGRRSGGRHDHRRRFHRRLFRPDRRGDLCRGRQRHGRGTALIHLQNFFFDAGDDLVVLLVVLEKVRDIEECVALQPDVHKRRLHAGQHPRHPAFVDASRQRVFVLALEIDFDYLVILDHRHLGFPAGSRDN